MPDDRRPLARLAAPLALSLLACAPGPRRADSSAADAAGASRAREEVAAAMQRYEAAARAVHPDSVAASFTTTATLFEPGIVPVRTRDSIRAFVASFPGVRV